MAQPVVHELTQRVYDEISQLQNLAAEDEANDWALLYWVDAMLKPLRALWDIVTDHDGRPGWGHVMNPTTVPDSVAAAALPWLAQFLGIRLTAGETLAQWRFGISEHKNFYRGSVRAITREVQLTMTGTHHVMLVERTSSAYRFAVLTEITEDNPAEVAKAIKRQKPIGLIATHYTLDLVSGWVWAQVAATINSTLAIVSGEYVETLGTVYRTWQDVVDHFTTWQDLVDNNPH